MTSFARFNQICFDPISANDDNENLCNFVSSRGIMKSCRHYNKYQQSGEKASYIIFLNIRDSDTVYICSSALQYFLEFTLPDIKTNIILVSGDSDDTIDIKDAIVSQIISSQKLKKWYVQNLVSVHPKIVQIPIGMDYHTMALNNYHSWGKRKSPKQQEEEIMAILKTAKPLESRLIKIFANFHFISINIEIHFVELWSIWPLK